MKLAWTRFAVLIAAALAGAAAVHIGQGVRPQDADIREVWMHREAYLGKLLRVSGTLKRFLKDRPKDHYAVESANGYRIGVEAAGLERLEGREVTAKGKATFDEKMGLRLVGASVAPR